jgi:hypothetical protein
MHAEFQPVYFTWFSQNRADNGAVLDCAAYAEQRNSHLICFSQLGKLLKMRATKKIKPFCRG